MNIMITTEELSNDSTSCGVSPISSTVHCGRPDPNKHTGEDIKFKVISAHRYRSPRLEFGILAGVDSRLAVNRSPAKSFSHQNIDALLQRRDEYDKRDNEKRGK